MDEVLEYIHKTVGADGHDPNEIIIVDADTILKIANFAFASGKLHYMEGAKSAYKIVEEDG